MRYCLIAMKARSHSIFQLVCLAHFRVAKNDFSRFVKREMNRPKAANRQFNCYTPFLKVRV